MNGKKSFLIESLVNGQVVEAKAIEPKKTAPAFALAFEPKPEPPADASTDPAPPPPMRNHTGKPALPADQWVDGIATQADALRIQKTLTTDYATACGHNNVSGRYYVRGYGWQWAT
jgi:hypothetical protein